MVVMASRCKHFVVTGLPCGREFWPFEHLEYVVSSIRPSFRADGTPRMRAYVMVKKRMSRENLSLLMNNLLEVIPLEGCKPITCIRDIKKNGESVQEIGIHESTLSIADWVNVFNRLKVGDKAGIPRHIRKRYKKSIAMFVPSGVLLDVTNSV